MMLCTQSSDLFWRDLLDLITVFAKQESNGELPVSKCKFGYDKFGERKESYDNDQNKSNGIFYLNGKTKTNKSHYL